MRTPPRAYLLLEVAIGGAVVAVIVGSILTSLSQARTMTIIVGRDQTASQLVVEKLDERRALGFTLVTAEAPATVTGVNGLYTRETTVNTACTEVIPAPGTNIPCKDITVTVTYQTSQNAKMGTSTTRTSRASARVYQ
jgi:hypothetical protein